MNERFQYKISRIMYCYRLHGYLSPTDLPVLPFVSFAESLEMAKIPTLSFDTVEQLWNKYGYITVVLHYLDNMDVYYFILPYQTSDTPEYHHMTLNQIHLTQDHNCDYYAKPLLDRFVQRLQNRLRTREQLNQLPSGNDPTEYEPLLQGLLLLQPQEGQDQILIRKMLEEVQERMEVERRYRPDGQGAQEAYEAFELAKQRL